MREKPLVRPGFAPLLALVLAASAAGCASADLEARCREQAEEIARRDREIAALWRRAELAEARLERSEGEVALLRARLEGERVREAVAPATAVAASHAPPPEPARTARPRPDPLVLDPDLVFAPGTAAIPDAAAPLLDKLAREIAAAAEPRAAIRIEVRAAAPDRAELATRRAQALALRLEAAGLSARRLAFAGTASLAPAAPGARGGRIEIDLAARP